MVSMVPSWPERSPIEVRLERISTNSGPNQADSACWALGGESLPPEEVMGHRYKKQDGQDFGCPAHPELVQLVPGPHLGIDTFRGSRAILIDSLGLLGDHARSPGYHLWRVARVRISGLPSVLVPA